MMVPHRVMHHPASSFNWVHQPRSNHFLVPVSVTNRGDETAEGVHVEVVLVDRGKEQESGGRLLSSTTLHPRRVGDIETDPRTVEEMKARVLGFENLDVDVPCNSCGRVRWALPTSIL